MNTSDQQTIRELFDEYVRLYSNRDDQLTSHFSEDFSGFTGGGDVLVKDREEWVAITRQDFAQVKDPIRIELKDISIQSLAETIAVVTGFFTIHLPIKDQIFSRETARLVLIFRKESSVWKITHSSISIPYYLVRKGEVYPLKELVDRNEFLEKLVAERTAQLSEANENLRRGNQELAIEIEERKRAGEALRWRDELQKSILNASPDDITIADREGHILAVSPVAWKLFGAKHEEEFLGRPVTDFIVPEDRERALAQVDRRLRGIRTDQSEYRGLRLDGSTFDIEVNSEFIRDQQGVPTGMVVIVRDITERKRMEAEKEKLEAQNRQLQKAESLGRMAGAIAHHFNNQLGTVIANLDLAMLELGRGMPPHSRITAAMRACDQATEMSRLMQTYLGQLSEKHKLLDLSEICRQYLPTLQAGIPGGILLETELPSPGPGIRTNAKQIVRVLTNLIVNSCEAIGEGEGVIQLSVKTVLATDISVMRRFPLDWHPRNRSYACLELTDTGSGIENPDIEKLFDPFFSTKFTGRGMGLAVVLGIVRVHNGVVVVESEARRGSTFRVYFPVPEDLPAADHMA